jgi:hypothetical protein
MRALRVYEAMDFERGRDPKTTLNIGLTAKRDFDTIDELVEWMFKFPEVFSEGQIREWDYKIERKKYGPDYYVIQYPQLRRNLLEYVKWIKRNIQRDGMDWGLKESKDAFNSLERFLIDRSEKRVHESVSFQRGQDPADGLELGIFQRRVLKKIKKLVKENWPDSEFIDEKISVNLEYYDTFFLQIKLKVAIKDINANNSPNRPAALSVFSEDLEEQMDKLELEIWDLSIDKKNFWKRKSPDILNIEILNKDVATIYYESPDSLGTPQKRPAGLIEESLNFKRDMDPKEALGIGMMESLILRLSELAEKYDLPGYVESYENGYIKWWDQADNCIWLRWNLQDKNPILQIENSEEGYSRIMGFEKILEYINSGKLDDFFFYES